MSMIEYKVSLIDVRALKPHERVEEARVEEVMRSLLEERVLHRAILADAITLTVIDGHHRLESFKRIGLTVVPVALVNYMDQRIVAARWDGRGVIDKKLVLERAARGVPFPPKTTRHLLVTKAGFIHVSEAIPEVNIELRALFEYAVFRTEELPRSSPALKRWGSLLSQPSPF